MIRYYDAYINTLNILEKMGTVDRRVILVRHATRDEIGEDVEDYEVPLNQRGIEEATAFGEKLTQKVVKIFTSPMERCIQTAYCIKAASKQEFEIEVEPFVSHNMILTENLKEAIEQYKKFGIEKVAEKLLLGKVVPGYKKPSEIIPMFLDNIKNITQYKGLYIIISHDFLIGLTALYLLKKNFDRDNWPQFMDGLGIVVKGESEVEIFYKDESNKVVDV